MLICDRDNREWLGEVMSNFDHSIDKDIAKKLRETESYADYSAWNFHGTVWYENEQYHCEIWIYHCHENTISNQDLQEIMDEASYEYGND